MSVADREADENIVFTGEMLSRSKEIRWFFFQCKKPSDLAILFISRVLS